MIELNDEELIKSSPSVLISDYLAGNKSLFVSAEVPAKRFTLPEFTLHLVIDAPTHFDPADATGNHIFFIDRSSTARTLGEGQYQIIFDGSNDDNHSFHTRASECADFFKVMQFNVGLVCVDYEDFKEALNACTGKILSFVKLRYDHLGDEPYRDHRGPQYRVIYGCLAGPVDMSLGEYSASSQALEDANPNLEALKFAMKIVQSEAESIMFLAEAV